MDLDADELAEILTDALWQHLDLRPRQRSRDEAALWARRIVDHLIACGVVFRRIPAPPPHGTPSY